MLSLPDMSCCGFSELEPLRGDVTEVTGGLVVLGRLGLILTGLSLSTCVSWVRIGVYLESGSLSGS